MSMERLPAKASAPDDREEICCLRERVARLMSERAKASWIFKVESGNSRRKSARWIRDDDDDQLGALATELIALDNRELWAGLK